MSIVFFGQPGLRSVALARPARVVFLTSLRDVALCDRNGEMIETPAGLRYMEGLVEHTVCQSLMGGSLSQMVEVVGVVTDDLPKDLHCFPAVPTAGQPWIHPLELRGADGRPVLELTCNIQSRFRALPRSDAKGRAGAKLAFEGQVRDLVQRLRAEVLVSDHYMARIEHLHAWFPGRVLNIHPGITLPGHPFRFPGKTPTADAIARAGREEGVRTGATLHIVDAEIDHGPAMACSADTKVYGTDQPQQLRYRNYRSAKLPVFVAGLVHYLTSIYPYLGELDFTKLVPL